MNWHPRPTFLLATLSIAMLALTGCGGGGGGGTTITALTTGNTPQDVVFGDFNGDGFADLAVANEKGDVPDQEVVSLYLGDGTGAVGTRLVVPQHPATPNGAFLGAIYLAVGKLNGDAFDDLVIVYHDNDSYAVALGNGTPATTPMVAGVAQPLGAGTFPTAAVLDRFDGDGNLDLAVINAITDQVVVMQGNGDGTFGTELARLSVGASSTPIDLASGDLDGDGNADLAVVVTQINANAPFWINGYLNDGTGGFSPVTNQNGTAGIQTDADVALADLNGDGRDDAVRTVAGSDRVLVFISDAGGALASHTPYTVGNNPAGVAVADVTGDGTPDIVTANRGGSDISILPGVGDGTFGAEQRLATLSAPGAIATGALNSGAADIATVHPGSNRMAVIPR